MSYFFNMIMSFIVRKAPKVTGLPLLKTNGLAWPSTPTAKVRLMPCRNLSGRPECRDRRMPAVRSGRPMPSNGSKMNNEARGSSCAILKNCGPSFLRFSTLNGRPVFKKLLDYPNLHKCPMTREVLFKLLFRQSENVLFEQSRNVPSVVRQARAIPSSGIVLHRVQPSRLPFGARAGGLDGTSPRCDNRSPHRREWRRWSALQSGK